MWCGNIWGIENDLCSRIVEDEELIEKKMQGIPQGAVFVNGTPLSVDVGESPNLNFGIFSLYNWDEGGCQLDTPAPVSFITKINDVSIRCIVNYYLFSSLH